MNRELFDPESGMEKFESEMEKFGSGMEKFGSGISIPNPQHCNQVLPERPNRLRQQPSKLIPIHMYRM
jgi:hypothetical protein